MCNECSIGPEGRQEIAPIVRSGITMVRRLMEARRADT
jgi:hypothetical protein